MSYKTVNIGDVRHRNASDKQVDQETLKRAVYSLLMYHHRCRPIDMAHDLHAPIKDIRKALSELKREGLAASYYPYYPRTYSGSQAFWRPAGTVQTLYRVALQRDTSETAKKRLARALKMLDHVVTTEVKPRQLRLTAHFPAERWSYLSNSMSMHLRAFRHVHHTTAQLRTGWKHIPAKPTER